MTLVTESKNGVRKLLAVIAAVAACTSIVLPLAVLYFSGVLELRDRLKELEIRAERVAIIETDLRAMQATVGELAAIMRKVSDDEALDERLRAASREMYRTLERRREDEEK